MRATRSVAAAASAGFAQRCSGQWRTFSALLTGGAAKMTQRRPQRRRHDLILVLSAGFEGIVRMAWESPFHIPGHELVRVEATLASTSTDAAPRTTVPPRFGCCGFPLRRKLPLQLAARGVMCPIHPVPTVGTGRYTKVTRYSIYVLLVHIIIPTADPYQSVETIKKEIPRATQYKLVGGRPAGRPPSLPTQREHMAR